MKQYRLDVIVALYIFAVVTAQLMGAKIVPFGNIFGFPLHVSVAVFLMPLLFTITDVVVEIYGKARARNLVRTGLIVIVLLTLYTLLVTSLPAASGFASSNDAYTATFGTSVRFALAAIAAYLSAELIDVLIYSKMRERMKQKGMWLRNNVSNFIGQFVDSTVFVVIAFYALESPLSTNAAFLAGIIFPYWALRCLMSLASTPLVYGGVAFMRRGTSRAQEATNEG